MQIKIKSKKNRKERSIFSANFHQFPYILLPFIQYSFLICPHFYLINLFPLLLFFYIHVNCTNSYANVSTTGNMVNTFANVQIVCNIFSSPKRNENLYQSVLVEPFCRVTFFRFGRHFLSVLPSSHTFYLTSFHFFYSFELTRANSLCMNKQNERTKLE